jgi:alanine racemase
MTRPTRAVIDLPAFVSNYRHAKSLAPGTRAVAVVKANAYGHGAVPLSSALADEADAFGVACIEEALELRASDIANPIILLEGVFEPAELADVEQHRFIQVVHSHAQLKWILTASPKRP